MGGVEKLKITESCGMKKFFNFDDRISRMAIPVNEYRYDLPESRIALYPLKNRDESKLLVYQNGQITHSQFLNLETFLPENSFLFFNDTKVIPARILFTKDTGAEIEIFLLSPVSPSIILSEAMTANFETTWECTIGNVKRWAHGLQLKKEISGDTLTAQLIDKEKGLVRFSWTGGMSFAEIVNRSGKTPLPPYLKRAAEPDDLQRYQTIYSHHEGAVAAPTAGLHFTERVFTNLKQRGIDHDFVTLHVSAGTFQPIKTETAEEHTMHHEQIVISSENIENLLLADKNVIAVGTTSMRTLESLYWFGVKLLEHDHTGFTIGQNDPYTFAGHKPSRQKAFRTIKKFMTDNAYDKLIGETSIFIKPGYRFNVCDGLITNFHQPASTLMLLVAAFIGNDWKRVYDEALKNDYRFLSYGDSSLLLPLR
jgi:S-adenosylmethionine:tRNA ribosyltransferase-isomerase